jgi:YbbR domain-containing protein
MIRRLANNLHWKLCSVAIAVVLWLMVVPQSELVASRSVPIFYRNLPPDLEIGSDMPDRVHIEIRGPASKLSPASLESVAVQLDLTPVDGPGDRTFTISTESLNLPRGISFLRAVPSQLRLRFDHILSKEVPVQVRVGTALQEGYKIVRENVDPPRLRIIGPEKRVRPIEVAQTDPVDLSGVISKAEIRVNAYVTDPQVRFQNAPLVAVRIEVQKIGSGK